jgi:activating signal cointegrator complex subunit 3
VCCRGCAAAQCLELRLWPEQHPLRQVEAALTPELLWKMEECGLSMERLDDMSAADIGAFLRHPAAGEVHAQPRAGAMHLQCWLLRHLGRL